MIVDISGTGTGNKCLFPFFTCTAHEVRVDLCDALRKKENSIEHIKMCIARNVEAHGLCAMTCKKLCAKCTNADIMCDITIYNR